MQTVAFPGNGRAEIIELPRPAPRDPGDAIVLVTTAAIGPWDVDSFLGAGSTAHKTTPGGEFAGIVVETGGDVSLIELDDLVTNTIQHVAGGSRSELFGSKTLPGGHAEYVRVPDADTTLTKIAASGEERAVLAGGTAALGTGAAAMALAASPVGTYTVVGCDPIGLTALIALNNGTAGVKDRISAIEGHSARRTLAASYAEEVFASAGGVAGHRSDVVIVGALRDGPGIEVAMKSVKVGGNIIFVEPYGASRFVESGTFVPEGVTITSTDWPGVDDAKRIVTNLQIRRIDLTPVVSHVMPLDEVQDAYEAAAGPGPGVQKVLLKM
tara:strand:- start:1404 stop:2381 length:978 start_codon:yes stop_codon:yes gene_type:complete